MSHAAMIGIAITAALIGSACAPDPPAAVVGLVIDGCDPGEETGSGVFVGPGLVLTAAHVVAGAEAITVFHGERSGAATVVGFDPEMDLAYLTVAWPAGSTVPVGSADVEAGDTGVAYVVRDRQVVALPVRVTRRIQIRTEDIYVQGDTLRPGFELDADIQAGDSGGAVVVDGNVVGVVWARSRKFDRRAYAVDPDRAAR